MDKIIEFLKPYGTPAIIVAIASAIVGSLLTFFGHRFNKKKERYETHKYVRSVFYELFELERKTLDSLAEYKEQISDILPNQSLFEVKNTDELLLYLDGLIRKSSQVPLKLINIASKASNLHYRTIAQKTMQLYNIKELLKKNEKLLNNYERYRAYHEILVGHGCGVNCEEQLISEARKFYDLLKNTQDFSNTIRMGITLVGEDIRSGDLNLAQKRLKEISNETIILKSGLKKEFLKRRFALLESEINNNRGMPNIANSADAKKPCG
jgi:hypothetical protein